MQCIVYWRRIRSSFEQFFATFSSYLWFETWTEVTPVYCCADAGCFRNSTDWFREGSYFSIAAASTERLVETRTCLCLNCHAFGFYNERPGLRVDTSRPESICHRLRRRKRGENIRSRFDLYCVSLYWRGFSSRWSHRCRSFRTTSSCCTLIGCIYQFLQRFVTACYYCANMNHTKDLSGTKRS